MGKAMAVVNPKVTIVRTQCPSGLNLHPSFSRGELCSNLVEAVGLLLLSKAKNNPLSRAEYPKE